jgi:hypothetical protein
LTIPRRPCLAALALLVYAALAVLFSAHTWQDPFHVTSGGNGDPNVAMWFIGWDAYSASHPLLNPFFTDFLDHPEGINLLWNAARWTQNLMVAPVDLHFGPVLAYNVSQVLALGLSGWTAYLAITALVRNRWAAFAGGLLYEFSPYMLGHAPVHSDYIFMPSPPLALLLFHRLATDSRATPWRWGVALGLLGAFQFMATEEVAMTMAITTMLGLALLALARVATREQVLRFSQAIGVALAVAAVLLAAPIGYQFFGAAVLHGDFHGVGLYETDLLGFVIPTSTLAAYPVSITGFADHFGGGPNENTAYFGIPFLVLLGYTAWRWRDRLLVRWSATMLLVVAVLSMGSLLQAGGRIWLFPLPWLIFQFLPIFGSILTARLMVFAYLMAAVLLAWFIARLASFSPRGRVTGGLLLLVVAVSLLPRAPLTPYPRLVPAFFTGSGVTLVSGETVLVAPFSADPGLLKNPPWEVSNPMLWQSASGMAYKMPDGYVWRQSPHGTPQAGPLETQTQDLMTGISRFGSYPTLCPSDREHIFAELRHWDIQAVVVGPMGKRAKMEEFFTDLLGTPPEEVQGVALWAKIPSTPPPGAGC